MSRSELERAKELRDLPDVYIGSAEREVEFSSSNFSALLNVDSTLADDVKRRIENEEGLSPPPPRLVATDD